MGGQLSQLMVSNGAQVVKGDELARDVLAAKDQEVTLTRQLELEEERIADQLRSMISARQLFNGTSTLRNKFLND